MAISTELQTCLRILQELAPPELGMLQSIAKEPDRATGIRQTSALANVRLIEQHTDGLWHATQRGENVVQLATALQEVDVSLNTELLTVRFQNLMEQVGVLASLMGEHHPKYKLLLAIREAEQDFSEALNTLLNALGGAS